MSEIPLDTPLPVGAIDTRSNGWWAMLWLIATEAALFAFLLFAYYYIAVQPHEPGTFPLGGIPSVKLSAPDTIILILSSVAVGFAQHGIMRGKQGRLVAGVFIGFVLGIVFVAIQCLEWSEKSFVLSANPYSSLFFTVTGFHMAHVIVGVLALGVLFVWSAMGYFNGRRYAHVHIVAIYWHFVDVVWLAIFFTFYITPRIAG
jgi:heme/copper-type cytochrome/quinol oxidase subunit 3